MIESETVEKKTSRLWELFYKYLFSIGCLTVLFLFSSTVFFLIWPYSHALQVDEIIVIPDVIQPGEELNIFSTYSVSMDMPIEVSISYSCESEQPLSPIQGQKLYFVAGRFNRVKSVLVAPSRFQTEVCHLVYEVVLKPNPLRRIERTYTSRDFTLIGAGVEE